MAMSMTMMMLMMRNFSLFRHFFVSFLSFCALFPLFQQWLERVPLLNVGDYDFFAEFGKAVHQMMADRRAEINAVRPQFAVCTLLNI